MIAACPYCATDVESDDATACSVCHTAHHPDCWDENHGCAVAACLGGPAPGEATTRPVPGAMRPPPLVVEIPEQTVLELTAPQPEGSREARRRAQRRAWVTVGIVAVCFVVVVVVVALLPSSP